MSNKAITLLEREAWDFAKEAHKGQVRAFTGLPYFDNHVQKVNGQLKLYTTDESILIAALLHDTLEDCYENVWIGYSEIKVKFGKYIADLVMELTSCKDEITYKYDGSKTNYLTNKLCNMSVDALSIKLADRLENIKDLFTANEKFRNKYYIETVSIMDVVTKSRKLNKLQTILINDINSKLSNINSIFKING